MAASTMKTAQPAPGRRQRLQHWQPRQWRWAMLAFFVVLIVPALALSLYSYRQLKWESLHRFQQFSAELSQRLDQQIQSWLAREEQRPSSDYFFFSSAATLAAPEPGINPQLNRSPLSYLPLNSPWPGALGYFQLDQNGRMTTPLLPAAIAEDKDGFASRSGLNELELDQRLALNQELFRVLEKNALAQPEPDPIQSGVMASANGIGFSADEDAQAAPAERALTEAKRAPASALPGQAASATHNAPARRQASAPALPEPEVKNEEVSISGRERQAEVASPIDLPEAEAVAGLALQDEADVADKAVAAANAYQSQGSVEGFQRLQQALEQRQRPPGAGRASSGPSQAVTTPASADRSPVTERVPEATDLAESDAIAAQSIPKQSEALAKRSASRAEDVRLERPRMNLEQSQASPSQPAAKEKAGSAESFTSSVAELDLASFQQLLGRFQFSPLESGHLLLFRQVSLAGQTYYQGLIIDGDTWVQQAIASEFYRSPWSAHSQLVLRHQDKPLARLPQRQAGYSSRNSQDNPALASNAPAQSHYRNRLAAPFDLLSVDFELLTLPPSPGIRVLFWTAAAFLLALSLGCWMMYRAGLRQIALARQQENFIAAVSHELKTPLTSIRMYGEMLSAGWVGEEKRAQYYRFIQDEGERLSRLIDQVLQLARFKRNQQALVLQKLSLRQLQQQFQSKILPYLERQGCEWQWLCPDELSEHEIQVDPDAIIQILLNLAENAVKFSAASGVCQLRLEWQQTAGQLQLKVSDCGPGLNPRQLEQIFQPFFRGEEELQRNTQGTGLGLALVDQLCHAQGIQISAANRASIHGVSGGAEFTLRFP